MTSATTNITTKVTTYWVSETAKVKNGGTKKKSNAATLNSEANSEGARPRRMATRITPSRYAITRFARSKNGNIDQASPVAMAITAAASAYPAHSGAMGRARTLAGGSVSRSPLVT